MLNHETPGFTCTSSLRPLPLVAAMCPELVGCACLRAHTWASYSQLNIETALAKIKPFFSYFLMGRGRAMFKYFTFSSTTFLLCFAGSEALCQHAPAP